MDSQVDQEDEPGSSQNAQSQAQASANSAYLTMAAVAEGALPKIRNVVQIIVIAIFPSPTATPLAPC